MMTTPDALELRRRFKDCANGLGSMKGPTGDYGIFDEAIALLDRVEAAEALLRKSADLTGLCTTPERFSECGTGDVFLRMIVHNVSVRTFLATPHEKDTTHD